MEKRHRVTDPYTDTLDLVHRSDIDHRGFILFLFLCLRDAFWEAILRRERTFVFQCLQQLFPTSVHILIYFLTMICLMILVFRCGHFELI